MKNVSLGRTLLTTSLAAALLVGGGAALIHNTAYAEDAGTATAAPSTYATTPAASAADSTTAAPAKPNQGKGFKDRKGGQRYGGNVVQEAAALLGIDEAALKNELAGGKTLAQVAQEKSGLSKETLVQKLSDAITAKLDEQVKNGTLTQAQADQAKANLTDRITKEVDGQFPFGRGGNGARGDHGGLGKFTDAAALAEYLKLTEAELQTKLQEGQSLSAIAQAQGISEDQLVEHIKESMTDKIKTFVQRTHKAPAAPQPAPAPAQ
ncbi:hypothetical protein ACFFK0_14790 [Paenibacillus chartarius]|uniref:LysM domain-containing protein n=1 Tax=Paenibacillus chartarius TaxID=747481 RepID=A0ABV6DM33_9BACL